MSAPFTEENVKDFSKNVKDVDPFVRFSEWMDLAKEKEINDPNAMALASVDPLGFPNVRMVLLKQVDERGFVFYTNFESTKGKELLSSGKAALCFHWKSLRRQVRVRGIIEQVTAQEADSYYHSRPRMSQIGAWASQQSRPLESHHALEKAVAHYSLRYAVGEIPRPPYWSGLRVLPLSIEFWQDRAFRLHERMLFSRKDVAEPSWQIEYLYP